MKTESSSRSKSDPPVAKVDVYTDDNGNYFAEVTGHLPRGSWVTWTNTFTTIGEAVAEAADILKEPCHEV